MAEADLHKLISRMRPERVPGCFVFVLIPGLEVEGLEVLATVREEEGLSAVVRQSDADHHGLEYDFVAAWITPRVESALSAVGLTAAVSACLTEEGISCNVVAGRLHDHLLVPVERVSDAITALKSLSAAASD